MPLSLRRGRVSAILERHDSLVRLEVDGVACVAYPRVTGDVEPGDEVLVNVQARELSLGSGGFDVLYANLTRGLDLPPEEGAHVVNLPYAPGQWVVPYFEEGDAAPAATLDGLPVVCCTVHSQLAPVVAGLGPTRRIAYVQVAGGALPVSLSDAVRAVRKHVASLVTVAVAPCFDGDRQAVSVASALAAIARDVDVAVCSVGPGIVGTGSRWGHGALALAEVVNVTAALGGVAILTPRVSDRDDRERHHGLSHHTEAVLALARAAPRVPWPSGLERPQELAAAEAVDVTGWEEACCALPLSFMGRGRDEEPRFFAAAFAAGRLAGEAADHRG
jgi:Protein of unknown function (DUF3866)